MNNPLLPADSAPDDDVSTRLAAILQQAYRTETADEPLARLEQSWGELCHDARRRVVWHRSLVATAAALLVAATLATASFIDRDRPQAPTIRRPSPIPTEPQSQPMPEAPSPLEVSPPAGLTPTLAQQALFTVRSRQATSLDLAALLTPYLGQPLDAASARLLAECRSTPQQLRTSLERDWARLPAECRPLAATLLVQIADRQSLATLRRMAHDQSLRTSVVEALLISNHFADLATPLEIAPAGEVATLLLSSPELSVSPAPLDAYLALVHQSRTRQPALAALSELENPPIDQLMAALDSDRKPHRMAAALALGELGGAEVTQRLIQLVTSGNRRHAEAWLAVVQCRGPLADEFLAIAARDPLLLGHYNAAVIRQQQLAH